MEWGRCASTALEPSCSTWRSPRYVPNVVYSCGAMLHQGQLIIPYGLADLATGFATVALDDVLAAMA
jgi:predicted GH43/DUF377 family glycosyl hydrolase